uniref:Putative RNI-like superfamily protein isoform 3 n=1 Tax=Davidia involucrata TaxID=16924 RepID=A0A5B7BSV4_DAVIN
MEQQQGLTNPFESLSEEIVFAILDLLDDDPRDKKTFSIVCKSFRFIESRHRKTLIPLRLEFLPRTLRRYPFITHLDLTFCPRVWDYTLNSISNAYKTTLQSIDLSCSRFFTHLGLSNLAMNCSSLAEIDLSDATWLTDSAAAAIAGARNLERLRLARCELISDIGVGCIAVMCKKLRFICLESCLRVSDLGVGLIANKCEEIRCLDLSYLRITKKCLPLILQLQHLNELILVGCPDIDDEVLATIRQGCKSLEALNLSNCQNVTHVGLSSLTNDVGSFLCGSAVATDLAKCAHRLSELQSIKLDNCLITSSGMKAIANLCAPLKKLSLCNCSGVTDEGLSSIVQKHNKLKKLGITCCDMITHVSIDCITSSCTSLTSLKMESCSLVSKEAFVLIGQRCRFLEKLIITDNNVDDEGLKSISSCTKLLKLGLVSCLNITDDGLSHVGKCCPKLTYLELCRSIGITDVGIVAIANGCPALRLIGMSYCNRVTDISLISLSNCSSLRGLEIRGCPCVSSAGLSAIAFGCRQLIFLGINECCNINDAGMMSLARYSQNLIQIKLSYCSVTDAGLLALASITSLKSMSILHVAGLTSNGLAAALLTCRGLTDVKLHTSFRASLRKSLLRSMEAWGCVFHWKYKALPRLEHGNAFRNGMAIPGPIPLLQLVITSTGTGSVAGPGARGVMGEASAADDFDDFDDFDDDDFDDSDGNHDDDISSDGDALAMDFLSGEALPRVTTCDMETEVVQEEPTIEGSLITAATIEPMEGGATEA